jgi:hypothetical protein
MSAQVSRRFAVLCAVCAFANWRTSAVKSFVVVNRWRAVVIDSAPYTALHAVKLSQVMVAAARDPPQKYELGSQYAVGQELGRRIATIPAALADG